MQFETLTVNGTEYNLKISARNACLLEESIGCSIVDGLQRLTQISFLSEYYFRAMLGHNDSVKKKDDVLTIFDEYIICGGTYDELQATMIEVLVTSGILAKEAADAVKNLKTKQKDAFEKLSK